MTPVPDLATIALENSTPLADARVLIVIVDPGIDVLLRKSGKGEDKDQQEQ